MGDVKSVIVFNEIAIRLEVSCEATGGAVAHKAERYPFINLNGLRSDDDGRPNF